MPARYDADVGLDATMERRNEDVQDDAEEIEKVKQSSVIACRIYYSEYVCNSLIKDKDLLHPIALKVLLIRLQCLL